MLNDEYDCEVKLKLFERRLRKYMASLRTEFTLKTILGDLLTEMINKLYK